MIQMAVTTEVPVMMMMMMTGITVLIVVMVMVSDDRDGGDNSEVILRMLAGLCASQKKTESGTIGPPF